MDNEKKGTEPHIAEVEERNITDKEVWESFDLERFLTDAAFFLVNSQMKVADVATMMKKEMKDTQINLKPDGRTTRLGSDTGGDKEERNPGCCGGCDC